MCARACVCVCDKICSAPKRQLDSLRPRKKKPPGEKPPSRKIGRSSHPSGSPTRFPRLPAPPSYGSRLCHRRPFACIFMKSLFRTTIHRDEQRTMTASTAEMEARRWRQREGGKKKESREREGNWYPSEREKRMMRGEAEKARTPTRATFSRSFLLFVRSFVRFFVMTVDETMTYFSGFSLPGCPAALPFMPTSYLPVPTLRPPPIPLSPRVHSGPSFTLSPSLVHFLSLCCLLFFADPSRLTPSSRVIYV